MKNKIKIILSLIMTVFLCSCSNFSTSANVDDLLSAPKLSEGQMEILEVLSDYIGEDVRLKYPRNGDFLSPLLFEDVDEDGIDEVIVLYSGQEHGKNVNIALLDKIDGEWRFLFGTEGLNTDVDRVSFANMFKNGSVQLVIGYSSLNFSDKYLQVYTCDDGILKKEFEQSYSQMGIADFTDDGYDDLATINLASDLGAMQLNLICGGYDKMGKAIPTSTDNRFTECTDFKISSNYKDGTWIVLDGSISGAFVASEVFKYNGTLFVKYGSGTSFSVPEVSTRNYTNLTISDVNGDGTYEVPIVGDNFTSMSDVTRMYKATWYDYIQYGDEPVNIGIVDSFYKYYLPIPDRFADIALPQESPDTREWILRDTATDNVLMFVRVLSHNEDISNTSKYYKVAVSDSYSIYLAFTDALTKMEQEEIMNGFMVL